MSGGDRAAAIVAAARALIGVPFRLHGRDPATGIDCVGLAALALERAGHRGAGPTRYGLRAGLPGAERWLAEAGLARVVVPGPGDLALVRPSPVQLHLMVRTGCGFIHAHAGVGRVVETPGALGWPLLGHWRPV
ncbi:MAG: peptidoglycan endopeptidase [Sphingobium sp.]